MEVTNKLVGMLSDHETMELLQDYTKQLNKKVTKNLDQNLATVAYETLQYLKDKPASFQNSSIIKSVVKQLLPYNLTKSEKLQLINLRPTSSVELNVIIEESEERLSEDQEEEILSILSQLPFKEEEDDDAKEEKMDE